MESALEIACEDGSIPGAVLVGVNRNGATYKKAFGFKSISDATKDPLTVDAIMWLASCTKLITAIAILQLVERGQVRLEDDISLILADLAKLPILTGFDGDRPILKERSNPITLRALLVHASGLAYPEQDTFAQKYRSLLGMNHYGYPLVFEPTTSWIYGVGIDWCGKLVEHLTGKTLEDYMKEHIFSPVGINDITFWPQTRSDFATRRMGVSARGPDGKLVPRPSAAFDPTKTTDCFGGHGCFGSLTDYIKILQSLLLDDEKLLKKETAKLLFQPHLFPAAKEKLQSIHGPMSGFPAECRVDWGLGGLVVLDDVQSFDDERNGFAGTLTWGGALNLYWFIDRKAGICGIFGTQVFPFGDPQTRHFVRLFEKAMYEKLVL